MNEVAKRNYVSEFRLAFTDGIESIVKAAAVYVEAIEFDSKLKDRFRDEFADIIPPSAWCGFEAVGRKWMHPKLLMGGGGNYASRIKKLPYSDQEKIFTGGKFEMLTANGDTLLVDVRSVTPDQAEQLFDRSHIRPLREQKSFLECRKSEPTPEPMESLPYTVSDGKVYFRRGAMLNRQELKRLLTEM